MDVLTLSLCSFMLFYVITIVWRTQKTRLRLPPGPTPLPIIGNLLQVSFALYKCYLKLSKQYGPIFTVWLGSKPVVALCGYTVIKEALINYSHQFSARGFLPISERMAEGYGIITTNGERWQQVRRFAVSTLRNFGMGKRSMEERVQEESRHLIKAIENIGGKVHNPHTVLGRAVNNVINLVVFGRRWDYDDKTMLKYISIINNLFNFLRRPLGVAYVAFDSLMKHLPGPHQKVFADCEHVKSFIREEIESHRRSLDPESPRDFIDCFLIQADKVTGHIQEAVPPIKWACAINAFPVVLQGTTLFPLLASALSDPQYWKWPYEFNPENFLDENGKFCSQEALIPFSAGKRICPGEGLARMEIFLFFTALLQKFSFQPANTTDTFNLDVLRRAIRKEGLSFNLRAIPRMKKMHGHTR
ncbi:PREDICTED: cytochrome P450 2G1-like [Nanorana parkeri]|uniref:cytochrome P450 2G1-like n=1 Tax=Nanorana parkeri TaxID=125878 RepID=UPI000854C978|nr:PREDICTED: cytochrome P450 2G1-like [Nanorana parkeri]